MLLRTCSRHSVRDWSGVTASSVEIAQPSQVRAQLTFIAE
ncbi:hypothetical protein Pd630_LPD05422 [Rhodococcus opacus PD630]|nr:hypothetical protein Pd630_LPD05422 [Rhodococcus opacus PD630]